MWSNVFTNFLWTNFVSFLTKKGGKIYFSSANLTNYAKIMETFAKDLISQS